MRIEKLVTMANQIAAFFAAQGEERAVPQIAGHIEKFWIRACEPRFRLIWRPAVRASRHWHGQPSRR